MQTLQELLPGLLKEQRPNLVMYNAGGMWAETRGSEGGPLGEVAKLGVRLPSLG